MSRLDELHRMHEFLCAEIAAEEVRVMVNECGGDRAMQAAADLYGVTVAVILSGNRDAVTSRARAAAAWLLRQRGMTYRLIGVALGVDHTSVKYAIGRVEKDPAIKALLVGIEAA